MKYIFSLFVCIVIFQACSFKKQILYVNDINNTEKHIIQHIFNDVIDVGDVLKIDVFSLDIDASRPYVSTEKEEQTSLHILNGYHVDKFYNINFPVIGKINVQDKTLNDLESYISKVLVDDGHLQNPIISVKRLNSKFTVLGEVNVPGTFNYYDSRINIFQALGYANDLTINGNRNKITLIREENGITKVVKLDLTSSNLIKEPYYYLNNNDIIVVEPNYSKIKSAGFIGSPASIASLASLFLSVTLLIINQVK